MHSEGNVSPWRIRVTVEAEREDEEGDGGGQHNVTPWKNGKSMKVPLKGTSSTEPTPKRRKTPRRKPVTGRVATPGRKKSLPPAENGDTGTAEKKKRGRPRKSAQPTDTSNDAPATLAPDTPALSNGNDPFFDLAMDSEPIRDSLGNEPDTGMFGYDMDTAMSDQSSVNGDSPGPLVEAQMPEASQLTHEEKSPIRPISTQQAEERLSPENTLHAGHTPRRKRLYPTPTSSSVLEENGGENRIRTSPRKGKKPADPKLRRLKDPTEDHREFDSILEGEDFSMVSLDTLPSAKQSFSGAAKAGLNAASVTLSASQQSLAASRSTGRSVVAATSPQATRESERIQTYTATEDIAYPTIEVPDRSTLSTRTQKGSLIRQGHPRRAPAIRRKPLARLLLIIRMGLALVHVFNRHREQINPGAYSYHAVISPDIEPEAVKQRLEDLFGDFSVDIKKDLHAGLWFGAELAKRLQAIDEQRQEDMRAASEEARAAGVVAFSSDIGTPPKITTPSDRSMAEKSPAAQEDDEVQLTPGQRMESFMAQRQAEWQREREAISRQIDAANPNQIIVLDEDDGAAPEPDVNVDYPDIQELLDANDAPVYDEKPQQLEEGEEKGAGGIERDISREGEVSSEEDDYEDIWQQEANQPTEPSIQESVQYRPTTLPRWEMEQEVEPAPRNQTRRLTGWSAPQSEHSIPSGGKTQIARYQNGDFEFSSLLGTPESATRRFYQGDFTSSHDAPPRDGLQSAHPQRVRHFSEDAVSDHRLSETPEVNRRQSVPGSSALQHYSPEHHTDEGHDYRVDEEHQHFTEESAVIQSPERSPTPHKSETDVLEDVHQRADVPVERVEPDLDHENQAPQAHRHPVQQDTTASSWFNKLTGLAPSWLAGKANREAGPQVAKPQTSENQTQSPDGANGATSQCAHLAPAPASTSPALRPKPRPRKSTSPHKPLALGGYFTDDHYVALYHLYKKAKQNPDLFPYEPTPERDNMLGRTMAMEDGSYPRQVTEIQIAIAVQFLNDLVEASRRRGGSDKLKFTELEIVWRLWSIMVGGKIRRERKLASRTSQERS